MKRHKLYVTIGLSLILILSSSCMFIPEEEETITRNGMSLVWSDEFDYTGVPNTAKWKYQTGNGGWGNNEIQNYIDNTSTATTAVVSDGTLKIKAIYDSGTWKSARMNSKSSWKYGYMEARMKITDVKGFWPAFWMMPQNSVYGEWPASGEIDIMENAPSTCQDHRVFSTLHAQGHYAGSGAAIGSKIFGAGLSSEWHTIAIKWTEDKITALYDDEVMDSYTKGDRTWTNWPYDQDFYFILNLAVGGNLGGSGYADHVTDGAVFELDYVRVYQ
jgi:beta-glucanase (GH16 family)